MAPRVVERIPAAGALAVALGLAAWGASFAGGGAGSDGADGRALNERLAAVEAERDALRSQVAQLQLELAREKEARLAREQAWIDYTRAVAELLPAQGDALPEFEVSAALQGEPAAQAAQADVAAEPERDLAAERSAEVLKNLRALLAAEAVRGLDLLEVGSVQDGWTGPVIFRLVDGQGRLSGSLYAERLSLEASRAARSLTLVLERGYESHGGARTPFGATDEPAGPPPWRIPLPGLDPAPWIESLPELFDATSDERPRDDGLWDVSWVRATLNALLRQDTTSGLLRLKRLGGVELGVLRDVHVEVLDPQGSLEQRLFADRLAIDALGNGVLLRFESGVHVRGDERTPFLDGGYRVWLPRARADEWRAAGVPGLAASPPAAGAAEPAGR